MAGKHPDKALSAAKVRNLKIPGRYADGNGLHLVVADTGAKKWVLRTVVRGRRRDIGLGGLSITSLAEAREEAARLRKIARSGGDPLAERKKADAIPTFEEAARAVHADHAKAWRNPKHQQQWINTLTEYAFPVLGNRRVSDINSADVLKVLSPIWLSKPETAKRVRQRMKIVFDWAKAAGHRAGDNPVEGVSQVLPKQSSQQQHHAALPYAQIPAFLNELKASNAGESVKLAFEFLILTALRTSEVLQAQWTEIDWQENTWTVPADRMKSKRAHRVPLSDRSIVILKAAQALSDGGPYIFPGRPNKPLSNMTFLMTLRRMGVDAVPHGFRSSFRDYAAEQTSFPREVCEAALAHTLRDKVEAAYNRTDLFEKRRQLMQAWTDFVLPCATAGVSIDMDVHDQE